VAECLPCRGKVLSSIPSTVKTTKIRIQKFKMIKVLLKGCSGFYHNLWVENTLLLHKNKNL
jgi:hypothetical protein